MNKILLAGLVCSGLAIANPAGAQMPSELLHTIINRACDASLSGKYSYQEIKSAVLIMVKKNYNPDADNPISVGVEDQAEMIANAATTKCKPLIRRSKQ